MNHLPQAPANDSRVISNFSKIRGDFTSQSAPYTGINDMVNFPSGTACVIDTGGKFATSANDTGQCQRHWWQFAKDTGC